MSNIARHYLNTAYNSKPNNNIEFIKPEIYTEINLSIDFKMRKTDVTASGMKKKTSA